MIGVLSGRSCLVCVQVCEESDEAFHMGADVSIISQFPKEQEITFPPYTMLVVQPDPENEGKPLVMQEFGSSDCDGEEGSCIRIVAKAFFI